MYIVICFHFVSPSHMRWWTCRLPIHPKCQPLTPRKWPRLRKNQKKRRRRRKRRKKRKTRTKVSYPSMPCSQDGGYPPSLSSIAAWCLCMIDSLLCVLNGAEMWLTYCSSWSLLSNLINIHHCRNFTLYLRRNNEKKYQWIFCVADTFHQISSIYKYIKCNDSYIHRFYRDHIWLSKVYIHTNKRKN